LELEPERAGGPPLAIVPDALVGAEQVLDVMAVFVGDDVGLGERATVGSETGSQFVVEVEVRAVKKRVGASR
jgi:hypothetical protein